MTKLFRVERNPSLIVHNKDEELRFLYPGIGPGKLGELKLMAESLSII